MHDHGYLYHMPHLTTFSVHPVLYLSARLRCPTNHCASLLLRFAIERRSLRPMQTEPVKQNPEPTQKRFRRRRPAGARFSLLRCSPSRFSLSIQSKMSTQDGKDEGVKLAPAATNVSASSNMSTYSQAMLFGILWWAVVIFFFIQVRRARVATVPFDCVFLNLLPPT